MREATSSQNHYNAHKHKDNTSGFKGVSWHKSSKKWNAKITYQGKKIHLGSYDIPEEAHEAYKSKAIELYGEFARFD